MHIGKDSDITAAQIDHPDVHNAAMKVLIGPDQGWPDHVMRVVELGPEGYSPRHTHNWPHINYMLEGEGVLMMEGKETPVSAGSIAYVPAGMDHQFRNTGDGLFRFICIVPKEGHM